MTVQTREIRFDTSGNGEAVDITDLIRVELAETGLSSGAAVLFAIGATCALSTVEYEGGLLADLEDLWERLAPESADYAHNRAWRDGNGHSHLRATLIGPSLTVPFDGGQFLLGQWQHVIFLDFDNRPRSRRVIVQCLGE